ncbi:AtpZ/AtpI family protein [Methylobacter sp. BlB1]|uniref:AtpZ/AtpI family protein n=1 Tax=unclassified Methylobacter TaxID=2635283 RepID=UPI0018942EB5|nr:AtpZ/AtpI family protein [Methylobacter sp. BlB1]MBF6649989.1 AtpZ/AtpI family protein [Methylobacter sp. BlB1]
MTHRRRLKQQVDNQVKRMKKAERERPNLLAQTVFLGTLGLVMVLPIIGGVYLGHWLDSIMPGSPICWTFSLMFAGIVVGIFNVYFLIQNK